ncbi:DUF1998 domain-containing protein [Mycobacterium avium]|uniref:DUF1998 domain-containing protein n=1 Tax=Mycobacterium avium TaxID=1764 RepID=UPI001CC6482D|nr:DUF1998 domain-containing protein [Mycobacterium avium]MBZ4551102.1 DUF1998 domain-containing protein [Mycobacterium avium subsp. hominissuis]MBZ4595675.1 DUF1998 domain-containing protein [Mycobacterium avium subsp. hominissuis]MBZ4619961.1 DUF1998 domain-containing protein [Mycobacterium avium subsp. hominissuis]
MTESLAEAGILEDIEPIAVGAETLDPIADVEAKTSKNYARVGSIRPSAMLYTNGIGATVDLPHFAVMPSGLDAWERVYARRPGGAETISEPRLLELTRGHLGSQVTELRKPPWAPEEKDWAAGSAIDLGIPCRIFPQWLRCTGCGLLAPVSHERFTYRNVVKYRPDRAEFLHENCKGFEGKKKAFKAVALPARYMIACVNGHLDEFPYDAWVHRGSSCSSGSPFPELRMREWKSNIGPDVQIHCLACQQSRGMLEAVGPKATEKLPMCRGRHPHLDAFYKCDQRGRLLMLGAANQWFPSTLGLLALPREESASAADLAVLLRTLPKSDLDDLQGVTEMKMFRKYAAMALKSEDFDDVTDELLWEAVQIARGTMTPKSVDSLGQQTDPRTILAPEWVVLTDEPKYTQMSGSRDFRAVRRDVPVPLQPAVSAVVAVEKLKKVNAFIGFTRIDALDRIDDAAARVAPVCTNGKPTWVPATEDRGEGVFLQFDESVVASWEQQVLALPVWEAFRQAHRINFQRRTSGTAGDIDPDSRFPAPRYWAIHTLSHLLIRQAAMSSGYGSASLTERIYAWPADAEYPAAAGLLISTTASDGEGTLGGLVELAKPAKLERIFVDAIRRGQRCSSDPICSHRVPKGKEEFLHGAACHFCLFLSETSCERTNRFLDRRLLLGLMTDEDVRTPALLEGLSIL